MTTSFVQMAVAAWTLVRLYRGMSSSLASSFYTAFRFAEGATGTFTPVRAPDVDRRQVVGTLWLVGREKVGRVPTIAPDDRERILGELDALIDATRAAMDTAFVDTSGVVSKLVLDGGRGTIVESVKADARAVGWARVTDGNPCAFLSDAGVARRGLQGGHGRFPGARPRRLHRGPRV